MFEHVEGNHDTLPTPRIFPKKFALFGITILFGSAVFESLASRFAEVAFIFCWSFPMEADL